MQTPPRPPQGPAAGPWPQAGPSPHHHPGQPHSPQGPPGPQGFHGQPPQGFGATPQGVGSQQGFGGQQGPGGPQTPGWPPQGFGGQQGPGGPQGFGNQQGPGGPQGFGGQQGPGAPPQGHGGPGQPAFGGGQQGFGGAQAGAPFAYGAPAPTNASPWPAMVTALGALRSEHAIRGLSRWGSLVFGIVFLVSAASSAGFGLLSTVATLSSRGGFRADGLVAGLIVGAPLGLVGGFLLFHAWRSWPLAAALFEKGVGYRDRKGARALAWGEFDAVWQAITRRYVNGVYAGTTHVYRARTRGGETLVFDDRLRDVSTLGEALVKATATALLPAALRAYEGGERVTFGPIALDRGGLHSGGKSLPWAEVKKVKIERGQISVDRDGKWFAWTRATVPQIPNFYVLVTLLDRIGKLG